MKCKWDTLPPVLDYRSNSYRCWEVNVEEMVGEFVRHFENVVLCELFTKHETFNTSKAGRLHYQGFQGSHLAYKADGYVGNNSAVFPLQLLGYDVDPINSVQFSNHTGYPTFKGQVLNGKQLWELIEGLEANNLLFYTHLLTGYIGSVSFLNTVLEVINKLRSINPKLTYGGSIAATAKITPVLLVIVLEIFLSVCDPVMGDEGKLYVPPELVSVYREQRLLACAGFVTWGTKRIFLSVCDPVMGDEGKLYVPPELVSVYREQVVPVASMLTPNHFEAEQLTGFRIVSEQDGRKACDILHSAGPSKVVVTSINVDGNLLLIGSHQKEKGQSPMQFKILIPKIPTYFMGTGDLMTALLLGWSNKYPDNLDKAAELAVSSVQALLLRTLADYQIAGYDPQSSSLEIRLIQSQDDIRSPEIKYRAEAYN
ncbi:unnamed protein product [Ilex paraguariensis]|uniref:pyridoxal kinase n=1 Tax=Ilex paraguariensis TaxID=185542 RepID=A0ABC8S5U3_9AQUA